MAVTNSTDHGKSAEKASAESSSQQHPDGDVWHDDVLERKPFADFLTESLKAQALHGAARSTGLTISLDAGWGEGKSFFVRHWMQSLRDAGHLAIYFDAWENDVGDEAAIALMASILVEVRAQCAHSDAAGLTMKIAAVAKSAGKKLRRAILPTATVVAKAALKKVTGVALDELVASVSSDESSTSDSSSVHDDADKVLDKIFEQKLEEHASKKAAIVEFRRSLADLINLASSDPKRQAPAFVFIDELDRCRPLYAVSLLEEAKHVFGVSNVVFVVSTNLSQLKHSIRALYGSDFDGASYLKRFFDREYVLPQPRPGLFSKFLISDASLLRGVRARAWLPDGHDASEPVVDAWTHVVRLFGLDLRSQKQVLALAEEVVGTLYSAEGVSFLWLFFLCIVFFKDRSIFDAIERRKASRDYLTAELTRLTHHEVTIEWRARSEFGSSNASATLIDVICEYSELSTIDKRSIMARVNDESIEQAYPYELAVDLFNELVNPSVDGKARLPEYAARVRTAGFVVA